MKTTNFSVITFQRPWAYEVSFNAKVEKGFHNSDLSPNLLHNYHNLYFQVARLTKPMDGANHSAVSEFVFLGLTDSWEIQLLLFVFSSTCYVASMMGNSLIMLTVTSDPHLHSPMYFLLAILSFIDLGASSVTSP